MTEISPAGRATLAALVERFGLPPAAHASLLGVVQLLLDDPLAPTTLRSEAAILADHIADSLVALEVDAVRAARALADLGSGAGFPGVALAAALPEATVDLVESNARKAAFLQRLREAAGLSNARVVATRVELWTAAVAGLDVVTARALAPLEVVAEYGAPLLRMGGTLVVWRGRRDTAAEATAARLARELGLEPGPPLRVHPYPGVQHRHLHLMVKVRETPPGFPRRPGVAARAAARAARADPARQ